MRKYKKSEFKPSIKLLCTISGMLKKGKEREGLNREEFIFYL